MVSTPLQGWGRHPSSEFPQDHTCEMDPGAGASRTPVLSAPVVLSRALVLLVLAAFIGLVYLAVPVGIGELVGSGPNTALSVAATAIVALVFAPVRVRTER